jgi:hypothetical protein
MRAETRKARINMQKERDQERRVELREVFRRKRAAYKEAIREAKIQSLRRTLSRGSRWIDGALLTDSSPARRGDKRHRGRPSRTARGTGPETAMALIRKYFPEDDLGTDTPENRETRASGVPVVGLGTQTGKRPREDDRDLRSSQIWPGHFRAEREDARQEEPEASHGAEEDRHQRVYEVSYDRQGSPLD